MTDISSPSPETPEPLVPIEEAKKELRELAGELATPEGDEKEEHQEAGLVEVEIARLERELQEKKVVNIQITRNALNALKDDIKDENTSLDTKLTVTDNTIDVETVPAPEATPQTVEETPSSAVETTTDASPAIAPVSPVKPPEKEGSKMETMAKFFGGLAAAFGTLFEKINKFLGNIGKYFDMAMTGLGSLEELDAWKVLSSSAGENIKNIGTIENPKKKELAALIASLVPEGKKIAKNGLSPVLEGFNSGSLEGDDLADALIAHIQANREKYGYEKPVPTKEETEKQEAEKKEKEKNEALENIRKIKIDGKNITEIPPDDLKDKEGKMKLYPKYGSEAETATYPDNLKYGEYTLWQLYNMKGDYDLANTTVPKIQLIKNVVKYFESLTPAEKDAEQLMALNKRLKIPTGETTPLVETPEPEKAEKPSLNPRDENNLVYVNSKLWQWDGSNEFIEVYKKESGELARLANVIGSSTLDVNQKGLTMKVLPYTEAQKAIDKAITETGNPAERNESSGYLWLPEGSINAEILRNPT